MNPLTNVKNIQKLNQRELELGVIGKKSWHDEYKDSAWVFIGGLPYDLTEGDIVCVFSQYGEIVNINLVRDKGTGKSKGFAFLCYEDQRSTVLAVDNLNSVKILGRIVRVDHVNDYKKPKEKGDEDEETLQLRAEGCAPQVPQPQAPAAALGFMLDEPPTIRPPPQAKEKKAKKEKKKKKKKKKMKVTVKVEQRSDSDSSSSSESSEDEDERHAKKRKHKSLPGPDLSDKLKQERQDVGYDRALHGHAQASSKSQRGGPEGDRQRDFRDNERSGDKRWDRDVEIKREDRRERDRDSDIKREDRRDRDRDSEPPKREDRRDRDRDSEPPKREDRRERDRYSEIKREDRRERDRDSEPKREEERVRERDDRSDDRKRDDRSDDRKRDREHQRDRPRPSGHDERRDRQRDRDDYDRKR